MEFFIKKIYPFIYDLKLAIKRYQLVGVSYPKNIRVYGRVKIVGKRKNITIGDRCSFNEGVMLSGADRIVIGDDVTLSSNVTVHTGYLDINTYPREHIYAPVIIGDNVWIASGSIVSAGVIISDNVVVGANSVVNKNLESNSFYAGAPIKRIKGIKSKREILATQ